MNKDAYNVRKIQQSDISEVFALMNEFAEYDGSSEKFTIDEKQLFQAYFDSGAPVEGLVIEFQGGLVGFANYFLTYSTFQLKHTIWLEDLFIRPFHRRKGLGHKLFDQLKVVAQEKNCARIEWLVRKDNRIGRSFYDRLGAQVDDETIYVKWEMN